MKSLFRKWWNRRHRWQRAAWAVYDWSVCIGSDVPEPPFPRPQMPRWMKGKV